MELLEMTQMVITPTVARTILDKSDGKNFRNLNDEQANRYARFMFNGTWQWLDASPIRITSDGVCTDGAHRLTACWLSDVPLRCVVWTLSEETPQLHLDTGRKRTLSDYARYEGVRDAPRKTAIAGYHLGRVYAYKNGVTVFTAQKQFVPKEMVLAFIHENVDLLQASGENMGQVKICGLNSTAYSVLYLELALVNAELAEEYRELVTLPDSPDHDPITVMRRFARTRFQTTNNYMGKDWTMDNLIKAWDAHVSGGKQSKWYQASNETVTFAMGTAPA